MTNGGRTYSNAPSPCGARQYCCDYVAGEKGVDQEWQCWDVAEDDSIPKGRGVGNEYLHQEDEPRVSELEQDCAAGEVGDVLRCGFDNRSADRIV